MPHRQVPKTGSGPSYTPILDGAGTGGRRNQKNLPLQIPRKGRFFRPFRAPSLQEQELGQRLVRFGPVRVRRDGRPQALLGVRCIVSRRINGGKAVPGIERVLHRPGRPRPRDPRLRDCLHFDYRVGRLLRQRQQRPRVPADPHWSRAASASRKRRNARRRHASRPPRAPAVPIPTTGLRRRTGRLRIPAESRPAQEPPPLPHRTGFSRQPHTRKEQHRRRHREHRKLLAHNPRRQSPRRATACRPARPTTGPPRRAPAGSRTL